MRYLFLLIAIFSQSLTIKADTKHTDFIGAGHDNRVTVMASSSSGTLSQSTIDGFQIKNMEQLKDASRFLAQATFGADYATIEMTAAMGYDSWLEEQFNLPYTTIVDEMIEQSSEPEPYGMYNPWFRAAWITSNLTSPDLLRRRLAFVWSQIMVINDNADFFEDNSDFIAHYYDRLALLSFANFKELLTHVTLSPAMGLFLSHYNNPKEDPAKNIHPDENYAREIMQLFSIGLWELNKDGTRKLDERGEYISTYNNGNIKEFAQVFTGLSNGLEWGEFGVPPDEFYGSDSCIFLMTTPMKMYNEYHDQSEKFLLNDVVLPAGQDGMEDVKLALDHLVNHNNTAPFICKSLIKLLTSSNPSQQYVNDVVSVFDPKEPENFQKVIKAILLHPEARNPVTPDYTGGKLREPVVRLMNLLRAFPLTPNGRGDYPMDFFCFGSITGQSPMESPSVFNFFLPEYQQPGLIEDKNLIAPEFHILNSTNAVGMLNDLDFRVFEDRYMRDYCVDGVTKYEWDIVEQRTDEGSFIIDFDDELRLADNPEALVNRLDILLANGLLESETKKIVENAIGTINELRERVKMAIYLIMISPDYVILK
ncbi:MAG: DUF1800 family protein [Bacteroidetes bacterium]|nr:DUF1800 family protein [Bacteroidota bacterium]